jgi:predicted acetyltransferase
MKPDVIAKADVKRGLVKNLCDVGPLAEMPGAAENRSTSRRGLVASVTVVEAPAARRPLLDRLLQLYLHDFSKFAPIGSPHGEVDEEGRFTYPRLESYWQQDGQIPLLIRAEDHLAGFVLVNKWSALDLPLDHVVAEFFVMRKYRRARVGSRAALLIFHRYSGRWEVPVAWYNPPAQAFWRKTAKELAPVEVEEIAGDGKRWAGPVLRFTTRP